MTSQHDGKTLTLSRVYPVPRALVFKAWSTAEHMKRWFSPEGMTVPEAEIDFRAGGVFRLCMRAPDGQDFWSEGHYVEVTPPERLSFISSVVIGGVKRFTVDTLVTFEDTPAGAKMSVRQLYDIHDPAFQSAIDGSTEGWRTTLDKLAAEVDRLRTTEGPPAVHDIFRLERRYEASPARVFRAFTDPAAKDRWFASGDGLVVLERSMDVRPGGRETVSGRWTTGMVSKFDALYFDVVPDARLVYAYEMHLNDRKISVSLATIEIAPDGKGTRLTVTEQGAFLNGYEDAGAREHGTGFLLDKLGESLAD